ncbi:MAG: rhomboid family intramembrane serine protease [Planctomycetes bacterium]|nr:rhomboid family intramembrane serine protease [Planctomycetota bacterium]
MNAWVQPPTHSAVGASTALFAAVGLLSAYTWRRQQQTEHRWTRRLAPLAGGVALLGLTGSGGEGTDVIAHLTGFFSGLLLGAVYGTLANRLRLNARMQLAFGSLAIGLLAFAWLAALRAQLQ